MANVDREPNLLDRAVISTVMSPLSLCLQNLNCVQGFQYSFFYSLYDQIAKSPEQFYVCDSPIQDGPRLILRKPINQFACKPFEKNQAPASHPAQTPSTNSNDKTEDSGEIDAKSSQPSADVINPALWGEITSKKLGVKFKIPKGWQFEDGDEEFNLSSPQTMKAAEENLRECTKPNPTKCITEVPAYDLSILKNRLLSPETMSDISIVTLPNRRVITYSEIFSMYGFTHYVIEVEKKLYDLTLINDDMDDAALTILSTLEPLIYTSASH